MIRFDFLRDSRPDLLDALMSVRLSRRWHNVAAGFGAVILAILAAIGIEGARCSQAHAGVQRAQARFDRSREALSRLQLQWQELDALIDEDRKLRAIRVSGPTVASGLARLGNLLVEGSSLQSMSADGHGYDLKGHAMNVTAFGNVLANAIAGTGVQRPDRVSVSRERQVILAGVSFEMSAGGSR